MMALGISALVDPKVAIANVEDRRYIAWGARRLRQTPRNLTATAAAVAIEIRGRGGGGEGGRRRWKSKSRSRSSKVASLPQSEDNCEDQESIFVPESPENIETQQYNAVFISDTHLGTPGCQADALLDFLKRVKTSKLYLVGDIVDAWHLQETWYWPQVHNEVFSAILRLGKKGTQIIYTPGNHDDVLRRAARMSSVSNPNGKSNSDGIAKVGFGAAWSLAMGNVTVVEETVHKTAQNKNILVIHGDGVDARAFPRAYWTTVIIGWAYRLFMSLVQFLKRARQLLKQPYWSLATYVRQNSRFARSIIRRFEIEVAREARSRELDGAICGHIHCPALKWIGNRIYGNSGDWVDNCTALVERPDGSLALMHYLPYFHRLQTKSEEQVEKEVKTSSDIPPGAYA